MPTNDLTTTPRKKRISELSPAGGSTRRDYNPHRIQNQFFLMFYGHAAAPDVRALLREMYSAWLRSDKSVGYNREHLCRSNEVVNDLCRIVEEAGG